MVILSLAACAAPAQAARLTLKSICRIKGQEENTIQGLGVIVGLKGTGDSSSYLPTIRSVAKIMSIMGNSPAANAIAELKDTKNVALVLVTATIPAAGARQGDKIDCVVSSIGAAKSLAGGRLFLTPLIGPDPKHPRVYAFAEGPITLENPAMPNTGRIHEGCRLEEEFFHAFTKDNRITLVLDKNHADFQVAQDIADLINSQMGKQVSSYAPLAHAFNQGNIVVEIPAQYRDDPVSFVSQVLVAADHGAAHGAAGGHQRANGHDRDQRRRGDRFRGRHAQEPGHRSRRPDRRAAVRRRRSGRSDLAQAQGPGRGPQRRTRSHRKTLSKSSRAWTATGKLHAPLIIE